MRGAQDAGQRGAALLTVLLMSMLLLGAGGVLLLITAMSTRTAIDTTSEMQAYYSAEAGLQAATNVLRGNIAPRAGMPASSKISFRNAVTLTTSNLPTDTSTVTRLSGWLNYDFTPADADDPYRVSLTPNYSPLSGMAYSIVVIDPDDTPVSAGEPTRLLLRAVGYGPKGAVKQLELLIKRSNFDYEPPATIMMRSSDDGTPITFTLGESDAKEYSGQDRSGGATVPSFGSTAPADTAIQTAADTKGTVTDPKAATVSNSDLPLWLQSATEARAFVTTQRANAISQGRYFSSFSGMAGSTASPTFTFVDGDCVLDGGAGLLIVTGNLELNGNPNFEGLILVLGEGTINRDGGGEGDIYGSIVVASFELNGSGSFIAPAFTTNGGGTSKIQYDSSAVLRALNMSGPLALGVHEY